MSVVKRAQAQAPRRRLSAEARRAKIIEAALQVFALRGYDAAAMGEIAAHAGIARPVLYDHFASKKDLFLTVLANERDRVVETVAGEWATEGPANERMRRAVDVFFAYVESHPFAWRVLFRETAGDAEIAERHRRIQAEANTQFAALFETDSEGRLDRQAAEMVAELLGSALNGLARWWYDRREVSREALVDIAVDVLWPGPERVSRRRPTAGSHRAP